MGTFVQMLNFFGSGLGKLHFDEKKDTRRFNEALKTLQENGAKILDVKVRLSGALAIYLMNLQLPWK